MRLHVMSVFVDDQSKAIDFYTNILGFTKKHDIPMGEARWLTVSESGADGEVEVLLEPAGHPAVGPYRAALVEDGIPLASFAVDDLEAEAKRLRELGVEFTQPVVEHGGYKTAVLDDTCGNLIQLVQLPATSRPA